MQPAVCDTVRFRFRTSMHLLCLQDRSFSTRIVNGRTSCHVLTILSRLHSCNVTPCSDIFGRHHCMHAFLSFTKDAIGLKSPLISGRGSVMLPLCGVYPRQCSRIRCLLELECGCFLTACSLNVNVIHLFNLGALKTPKRVRVLREGVEGRSDLSGGHQGPLVTPGDVEEEMRVSCEEPGVSPWRQCWVIRTWTPTQFAN
jgi:hypothetical protein